MEREQQGRLAIRLLGAVEVDQIDEGESPGTVPIGGPIQRRILAALVAARPDVVSIDRLADITWLDAPPARADHNIRTYISRLRSALGDAIEFEQVGDGYRVVFIDAAADIDRFEELLDRADRLRSSGATADALTAVGTALSLWRGAPFGEFAFEPWAQSDVARLEERHHAATEMEAELLIAGGRPGDAVNRMQALAAEQPLREQPRALLMRALYASGRATEALRVFHDYQAVLRTEVGLDPSSELAALDQAIARGELVDAGQGLKVGGFVLHERIGAGAFAVVHRATQTALDREVAIKIIRTELATQPSFVRGFEREARVVARLEHDAIVPLYDFWRDPDQAYLVMRHLPGGSLADRLDDGPLASDDVLAVVERIGGALGAAHAAGVVHRDVKPANILFDAEGRAVLSDFGIAVDDTAAAGAEHSGSESSARFAAPEQLRGEQADARADVYSLALVTWAALTGRSPFATLSSEQIVEAKASGQLALDRVDELRSDVPPSVGEIIDQAISADAFERPRNVQAFVDRLRAATTQAGGSAAAASVSAEPGVNPYQGLRAFDEATAQFFHGRQALVDELVDALGERRLVTVVGASGSGKSSVVRAGLLPALQAGAIDGSENWFVTSMTPGARPFEALETATLRVAVNPPGELLSQLTSDTRGLARAVERLLPERDGVLLLVVDQFEELFTSTQPDVADRFLTALATALAEPESRLRVVATLRGDFYDRPLRHQQFAPLLKASTVAVTPLSPAELEQVILAPATAAGVAFEAGLVARIMSDASDQPGGLALLEYALTMAFDASDGRTITAADYDGIGGIDGALVGQAERLHDSLDAEGRTALRRIMGALVSLGEGAEDTRRRALRSELGAGQAADDVIDVFSRQRLFTLDHDPASREPTVEVAHETLIRAWPRLRSWLDDDRDDLRLERHLAATAREWDAGDRPDSELYRGGRLEAATEWRERTAASSDPVVADFLDASTARTDAEARAEAERLEFEQRSNRRLRRLLAGVAVLLVMAMVAGGLAFQQRQSAQDTAFDAETSRLVATAQSLADTNPQAALLLAVAAHQREQTAETLGALQVALVQSPLQGALGSDQSYVDVEWLSNGLIAAIRPNGVDLYDPDTSELLDSVRLDIGRGAWPFAFENDRASSAAATPLLAVLTEDLEAADFAARVYDASNGTLEFVHQEKLAAPGVSTVIDEAGDRLALVGLDNILHVIDPVGGRRLWSTPLDQSANLLEQTIGIANEDDPFSGIFVAPVFSSFHPAEQELIITNGVLLHRFDWEGQKLADPEVLSQTFGGIPTIGVARTVLTDEFGPRIIATDWGVWDREHPVDPWLERATVGVSGVADLEAGSVEVVDAQSTAIGDVFLLSDGRIVAIDAEQLTIEELAAPPIGVAQGIAVERASGRKAAVASSDGGIFILDLVAASPIADGFPRGPQATNLSISQDGDVAVAGGAGTPAQPELWRQRVEGWARSEFRPDSLDFFISIPPRESAIWVRGGDDSSWLYTFDDAGVDPLAEALLLPPSDTGSLSPSEELAALAGGYIDGEGVKIHEWPEMTVVTELPVPLLEGGLAADASDAEFRRDSSELLVAMPDGQFELWDVETWQRIDVGEWADEQIALASWSDDGKLLATADPSGAITIRGGEDFAPIRTLVGSVGTSNSWGDGTMLFSADNALLLTNIDNVGRLWDLDSGQQIGGEFPSAPRTISGINRGENGLQLITASERGSLIWNLNTEEWPEIACRAAGRELTEDEWEQWGPRDEPYRPVCSSA